jgi:hypothetical protein
MAGRPMHSRRESLALLTTFRFGTLLGRERPARRMRRPGLTP